MDIIDSTQESDMSEMEAQRYNYKIAEMLAHDNHPLSFVEAPGFVRLLGKLTPQYKMPSQSYFAEKIIPDIYNRIHAKISANIVDATAISISADWTCLDENDGSLTLTAHWVSSEFEFEHAVLSINPLVESHCMDYILKKLNEVTTQWNLPRNKLHILTHNSDAHIMNSANIADIQTNRCFVYSLHLAVKEALETQPIVIDMIIAARKIVAHFNNSYKAQEDLETIQESLNLPQHELVEDFETRWISTYYLLERLLEQRIAISEYNTRYRKISNLTPLQYDLIEQIMLLLKPFEEITKITTSQICPISEVIPNVATLLDYLSDDEVANKTPELQIIRTSLITEIHEKYLNTNEDYNYLIATFLDPRFKMSFIGIVGAEKARLKLIADATMMSNSESSGTENEGTRSDVTDDSVEEQSIFRKYFNKVANCNIEVNVPHGGIADEFDLYLKTIRIDHDDDPYEWWLTNSKQYPNLIKFARIYLSSTCSSVINEKLYSEPGVEYEEKLDVSLCSDLNNDIESFYETRFNIRLERSQCIDTKRLEFIGRNLPFVNFEY